MTFEGQFYSFTPHHYIVYKWIQSSTESIREYIFRSSASRSLLQRMTEGSSLINIINKSGPRLDP